LIKVICLLACVLGKEREADLVFPGGEQCLDLLFRSRDRKLLQIQRSLLLGSSLSRSRGSIGFGIRLGTSLFRLLVGLWRGGSFVFLGVDSCWLGSGSITLLSWSRRLSVAGGGRGGFQLLSTLGRRSSSGGCRSRLGVLLASWGSRSRSRRAWSSWLSSGL
jgi:hypothetical protein